MNANTALKINDAVDQAIRCGESVEATRAQFERALDRAVEQHRGKLHAEVRSVPVTLGLTRKTVIEYQAYAEGFGLVASSLDRGFAEQAALDFNARQ